MKRERDISVARGDSVFFFNSSADRETKKRKWQQDIHVVCIPIEERPDLDVVIVFQGERLVHTEVVHAPTEDMEPMDLPAQRPLPYGQYRTSTEVTNPTKEEVSQGSNDMQESSH